MRRQLALALVPPAVLVGAIAAGGFVGCAPVAHIADSAPALARAPVPSANEPLHLRQILDRVEHSAPLASSHPGGWRDPVLVALIDELVARVQEATGAGRVPVRFDEVVPLPDAQIGRRDQRTYLEHDEVRVYDANDTATFRRPRPTRPLHARARLMGSVVLGHVRDSVVLVVGDARLGNCERGVVIATGALHVGRSEGCVILAGGRVRLGATGAMASGRVSDVIALSATRVQVDRVWEKGAVFGAHDGVRGGGSTGNFWLNSPAPANATWAKGSARIVLNTTKRVAQLESVMRAIDRDKAHDKLLLVNGRRLRGVYEGDLLAPRGSDGPFAGWDVRFSARYLLVLAHDDERILLTPEPDNQQWGDGAQPRARVPVDTRVHVVSSRMPWLPGHDIDVHIDDDSAPVVIVLMAYEGADWRLRFGEGTRVVGVVLSGTNASRVHGVPRGVPVLTRVWEFGDAPLWAGRDDPSKGDWQRVLAYLDEQGLGTVVSFQSESTPVDVSIPPAPGASSWKDEFARKMAQARKPRPPAWLTRAAWQEYGHRGAFSYRVSKRERSFTGTGLSELFEQAESFARSGWRDEDDKSYGPTEVRDRYWDEEGKTLHLLVRRFEPWTRAAGSPQGIPANPVAAATRALSGAGLDRRCAEPMPIVDERPTCPDGAVAVGAGASSVDTRCVDSDGQSHGPAAIAWGARPITAGRYAHGARVGEWTESYPGGGGAVTEYVDDLAHGVRRITSPQGEAVEARFARGVRQTAWARTSGGTAIEVDDLPTARGWEVRIGGPATLRRDLACPPGARRAGAPPPDGFEQFCVDVDRHRHGPYVRWAGGLEVEAGRYEHGARTGLWFVRTQRLDWLDVEYCNGRPDGVLREWQNGQRLREVSTAGGVAHGVFKRFAEGRQIEQGEHRAGRRWGWWYTKVPVDDGRYETTAKLYGPRGQLLKETPHVANTEAARGCLLSCRARVDRCAGKRRMQDCRPTTPCQMLPPCPSLEQCARDCPAGAVPFD